jgi:hypothetical protein
MTFCWVYFAVVILPSFLMWLVILILLSAVQLSAILLTDMVLIVVLLIVILLGVILSRVLVLKTSLADNKNCIPRLSFIVVSKCQCS